LKSEPPTPTDTVDRTIRNQRYRGWPVPLLIGMWGVLWMGTAYILERFVFPPSGPGPSWIWLTWVVPVGASFPVLIRLIDRRSPKRLKLGDDMWPVPHGRVKPKDIRAFHFARDPDEDYVEKGLPIPWCELTVEYRKRRRRLIVSFGDAARVREWAEQKGVTVIDPEGYSHRLSH
jgi:hypothetical protein